jgi:transcriptional regulator with XRE-family HTH domain
MKLSEFLSEKNNGMTASEFAARLGISRQALHRYMKEERRPEWNVLQRIFRETGGAVTPNDFLDKRRGRSREMA